MDTKTKPEHSEEIRALLAEKEALQKNIARLEAQLAADPLSPPPPRPAVLEKMACGLSRQQAETVVAEQAKVDAYISAKRDARPRE